MKHRLFYINRFLGKSVEFRNGFSIGFNWVHGNGSTTKTSAILAGYHPPRSITWRWALYWMKPRKLLSFGFSMQRTLYGRCSLMLPLVGGFDLSWQPYMWRDKAGSGKEPS